MQTDRPLLGIMLMLLFCIIAPAGDAIAKILGGTVPLLQLVTVRFAIQAAMLLPLAWWAGMSLRLSTRVTVLTAVRTALHVTGIGLMFLALRFLPLADAVAIAFVMPFIMLILGHFVLGEEVGARRMIACAVGFAGTLMVIQPSFAEVGWAALLPVGVAFVFAAFMMVTRQIAKEADPIALQCLSGLMASVVLIPALWLAEGTGLPDIDPAWPSRRDLTLLVGLGILGTLAHLMMTWSLRFAPASTLAPMQYLEIPAAAAIGWLVFADFPNGLALAGIGVTVVAGLYIIARERAVSRRPTPPLPAPSPPS